MKIPFDYITWCLAGKNPKDIVIDYVGNDSLLKKYLSRRATSVSEEGGKELFIEYTRYEDADYTEPAECAHQSGRITEEKITIRWPDVIGTYSTENGSLIGYEKQEGWWNDTDRWEDFLETYKDEHILLVIE